MMIWIRLNNRDATQIFVPIQFNIQQKQMRTQMVHGSSHNTFEGVHYRVIRSCITEITLDYLAVFVKKRKFELQISAIQPPPPH